jgi:hypothetical protein
MAIGRVDCDMKAALLWRYMPFLCKNMKINARHGLCFSSYEIAATASMEVGDEQ